MLLYSSAFKNSLRLAFFLGVLFLVFSGCQKPQANGWDGTYCYRWKEEFNGQEKVVDFLNTCSGEHEQLVVLSRENAVSIDGPEGARTFTLTSAQEGRFEATHRDCNDQPYTIRYSMYKVGKSFLLETSWNDGQEHLRRTSYTLVE
ncbi:MAG: hypothetical protein GC205_11315 [Bacteroidetes bacterium]|nr:hypothetical protein [Bacteroidota bacterium]